MKFQFSIDLPRAVQYLKATALVLSLTLIFAVIGGFIR